MYYFGNGNPATSDGLLMVDYLASAFNLPSPNSDFRQQKTCDYDVSTAMDNTFFLLNGMPQAQIIRYRSLHSQFDSFSDSLDSLCSSPQGKVLLMLGKVQFELQKLVDVYRSHVFKTITVPSDSLLNELQTVEEMKEQCDEKRQMYEHMRTRQREKGRGRNVKGEESFWRSYWLCSFNTLR